MVASHRRNARSVPAPRTISTSDPAPPLSPPEKSTSSSAPVAAVSRSGPVGFPDPASNNATVLSSPAVANTSPPGVNATRCVPPTLALMARRLRAGKYTLPNAFAPPTAAASDDMLSADAADRSEAIALISADFFCRCRSSYRSFISFIFSASAIFICISLSTSDAFSASIASAFATASFLANSLAAASNVAVSAAARDSSRATSSSEPRSRASSRSRSAIASAFLAVTNSSSAFACCSFAAMTCWELSACCL